MKVHTNRLQITNKTTQLHIEDKFRYSIYVIEIFLALRFRLKSFLLIKYRGLSFVTLYDYDLALLFTINNSSCDWYEQQQQQQ